MTSVNDNILSKDLRPGVAFCRYEHTWFNVGVIKTPK